MDDNNIRYKKQVLEIIKSRNQNHIEYEDVSSCFSYVNIAARNGSRIILFLSDGLLQNDLIECRDFFKRRQIDVYREYFVTFDKGKSFGNLLYYKDVLKVKKQYDDGNTFFFSYIIYPLSRFPLRVMRKCLSKVGIEIDYYRLMQETIQISLPFYSGIGVEIYNYSCSNTDKILEIIDLLDDDISRDTLLELLRVASHNSSYTLVQGNMYRKYWDTYRHLDDEVWVNCGSAYGDTILKYLQEGYVFKKIIGFEGDRKTFDSLEKIIEKLPEEIRKKIVLNNSFLGEENQADSFDNLFMKETVTLINMDIEGAEMAVLRGAKELIKRCRPVLAICAYHKAIDWWNIPTYVKSVWGGITYTSESMLPPIRLILMNMFTTVFRERDACKKCVIFA